MIGFFLAAFWIMFMSRKIKTAFMKIHFLLFLASFFLVAAVQAQGVERKSGTSAGASQIYLELGGSGLIYTLNFDKRLSKMENGLGFRLGIGGAGSEGSGYVAIPAQLNYLLGENGKYLELGAGVTFLSAQADFFFNDETQSTVLGNAVVGFRSQPFGKKGFTWRAAFTPFISNGFLPYFGASIGYRF
jgi:hypothetical protein